MLRSNLPLRWDHSCRSTLLVAHKAAGSTFQVEARSRVADMVLEEGTVDIRSLRCMICPFLVGDHTDQLDSTVRGLGCSKDSTVLHWGVH